MSVNFDLLLPALEEFALDGVGFKIVDPSKLPGPTLKAFDVFMRGSTVPHPIYVYSHDYDRFCMLVRQGRITIEDSA